MKTLFVTGAEGFTGKHLVKFLGTKGYDIVGGVRNRARKLAFEKQFGRAIVCDVSDAINVARAIASVKPDGVIHLAGTSQPFVATEEPLIAYQSIVSAWANVLDGVRRVVPRARCLLVSSCEVYGKSGDPGDPLREDAKLQPVNTFGALKAAAESIAHTFFKNYHTNCTIARPFHFSGDGQSSSFFFGAVAQSVVGQNGHGGTSLDLPDLDCQRELLHVEDVVEAYWRLLEEGRPNTVYNVCAGRTWSVRDICQAIVRAAGRNVALNDLNTDDDAQVKCYRGDGGRMKEEFGWQPTRSFDDTIRELVQSYHEAPADAQSPSPKG